MSFESERAKYQRWLDDLNDRIAASRARLEEETRRFDQAQLDLAARHAALRALLEYANGSPLSLRQGEPAAIAALTQVEPPIRAEDGATVTLVSFRAPVDAVLGPRAAAATPLVNTAPPSRDFVASIQDPELAARVRLVSGRIEASRRYSR